MPTRVGIDLVSVQSVQHSLRTHGRRYLDRVYTPREQSDCRCDEEFDAERLAARFAAKEAVMKVLRPTAAVPWNSIGVRREPEGWASIEMTGAAAELASELEITDVALSLTHEDGLAAAAVIATMRTG
jgi:holo-[acyl-carrier protein] synthase